ncbi:MAG: fused MFS/spermidine synthase [Methylococcales bacterium]
MRLIKTPAQLSRLLNIHSLKIPHLSSPGLFALIFGSGLISLIYEITWIRQAGFVFGSSALALSTVLAVFFLGLGLGSFGIGRVSPRLQRPLLGCAVIELLLAVYGLCSHTMFGWVDGVYGAVYRELKFNSEQLFVVRATLVTMLLLPPTLLMGGTLPLFCKQLISDSKTVSRQLGLVYGFNTIGAAVGCFAAGFLLLPHLGVKSTLIIAAGLNVLVGLGFWRLQRTLTTSRALQTTAYVQPQQEEAKIDRLQRRLLPGILFFMIGATGLANELLWARFLIHFIRNSIYTYTLALGVVLIGIGLGSFWSARKLSNRQPDRYLLLHFALLQALSAVLIQGLTHLPGAFWTALTAFGLLPFAVLMLPSAIIAGASFPLLNTLGTDNVRYAGRDIGVMTALNILGCIFGSLLTGYWLLPHLGLDKSIMIVTACALASALLATFASWPRRVGVVAADKLRRWAVYGLSALWLVLVIFPAVRIPQDFMTNNEVLVDYVEGYNSNLAVTMRAQEKTLLIDRLWQGVARKNYQIMVAHIPMLHYPEAKDVLVVGLGAGKTASRFLYYDIQHLDIVDIEPRLFEFTRKHFPSAWMDDSRVRLLPEDGRNYIKSSAQLYDLISVEIGQLDRPGVGIFYTREFYQQVRARLRDDGMVSQFVPLRFLSPHEFASILQTFLSVFPKAQLWYNTDELLLLGFKNDIHRISPQQFTNTLANPVIKEDIAINYWGGYPYNLDRFPAFISGFLASGEQLNALANITSTEIYTDDKLQLSYSVSHYQRDDQNAITLAPFLQINLTPIDAAVTPGSADPKTLESAGLIRDYNVVDIVASDILGLMNSPAAQFSLETIYQQANQALKWNPRNIDAQALLQRTLLQLRQNQGDTDSLDPQ